MFLNPLMLAGLAGSLVPLLLHLLARSRVRAMPWAAMMFLSDDQSPLTDKSRLLQWLLLAIRMGLTGLLAMLFARPVLAGAWGSGSLTLMLLVDASPSTASLEAGRPRLDLVKDAAAQVLAGLGPTDRAGVVFMGAPPGAADIAPTTDRQAVAARIASTVYGPHPGDVVEAISRAKRLVGRSTLSDQETTAVAVVLADLQAVNWRRVNSDPSTRPATAAPAGRMGAAVDDMRLIYVPVGGASADNLRVDSVEVLGSSPMKGLPADIQVTIRNTGPQLQPAASVRVTAAGKTIHETAVAVPAGGTASVRSSFVPQSTGPLVIGAQVQGGVYPYDDSTSLAVIVTDPVKVTVVSGDQRSGAFQSEADFFTVALSPHDASGEPGTDPAGVRVVDWTQWSGQLLESTQVLVLANVPTLRPEQVRQLERFVYDGGGLLLSPGPLTNAEAFNRELFRDGSGLSPSPLPPPTPDDGSAATHLLGFDLSHPAMAFARGFASPLPQVTIGRYFPLTPTAKSLTLATFASGNPFLLEMPYGKGRVVLMATPLDVDWSGLPLSGFYLPLMQSLVRHLAVGAGPDRSLESGEPIVMDLPPFEPDSPRVRLPSGRVEKPQVSVSQVNRRVRFDETSTPGAYELIYRTGDKDVIEPFVVSADRTESDLTPLDDARWDEIALAMDAARVNVRQSSAAMAIRENRAGTPLHTGLLFGALALSLAELAIGRRMGRTAT